MQRHYTKLFHATLLASLVLFAVAGAAAAGPLEDAAAASQRGDYPIALRIFRPLAEQGNPSAQSALGFMYENAQGVPQNHTEAAKWYRLAAEQGDGLSQTRLGFMYQSGKGVQQDYAEAAKWLRLAAEQGRAVAQNVLGGMYLAGLGVPRDYVVAYMWLSLSAAQGDHDAASWRDVVAKLMATEQIAEGQRLVREWKPKRGR